MDKIILEGHVIVPESDIDAVLQELPKHIDNTRSEEGCLVFEVSQDKSNKNKLNVYEEFIDKESFKLHQERVKNSDWGNITKCCERHYSISGL